MCHAEKTALGALLLRAKARAPKVMRQAGSLEQMHDRSEGQRALPVSGIRLRLAG
jgi:hypothetical protein